MDTSETGRTCLKKPLLDPCKNYLPPSAHVRDDFKQLVLISKDCKCDKISAQLIIEMEALKLEEQRKQEQRKRKRSKSHPCEEN